MDVPWSLQTTDKAHKHKKSNQSKKIGWIFGLPVLQAFSSLCLDSYSPTSLHSIRPRVLFESITFTSR